jgi:hypothetical protein
LGRSIAAWRRFANRSRRSELGRCVWCSQAEAFQETAMKGVALWALGIPIPVIILLYVFHIL